MCWMIWMPLLKKENSSHSRWKSGAGSTFFAICLGIEQSNEGKGVFQWADIAQGSYSEHRRDHILLSIPKL